MDQWGTLDDLPPGSLELRRQISRRYLRSGATVAPEEIIVTSGALEALNLSLQSLTRPGDLKAIEIPTHPANGVDLAYLAGILDKHPVRACWFMTSFQNPMGARVPDEGR